MKLNKSTHFLVFAILFGSAFFTASAAYGASTSGILGANNPHAWYDSEAYTALDAIKNNGFNTVRIVWQTSGSGSRLGQIISRCKVLGLKPIPELHDVTGGNSASEIDNMVTYWLNNKSNVPSDVWVNIANEWGPSNSTTWRDAYVNGIKRMRSGGMSNTIVVDSGGWGQDDQDILNYGPAILAADSNVVFSIHMYGSWNDNNKVSSFLTSCQSKGLPIMVGEFGYNYNNGSNNLSCKVDAAYVISTCKSKGIGYIGWSWCGNNSENAWLDMTNDWKTLNTWGNLVKSGSGSSTNPPSATSVPTSPPSTTTVPTNPPSGSCGTCNWYGTNYPMCCTDVGGWGWENNQSCISQSTCNSQGGGSTTTAPTNPPSVTTAPTSTPANTTAPTNPPSGGSCGTCNWYGTNYPMCCTDVGGWGWENNQSCISQSTCNSQ